MIFFFLDMTRVLRLMTGKQKNNALLLFYYIFSNALNNIGMVASANEKYTFRPQIVNISRTVFFLHFKSISTIRNQLY